MPLHRVQEHLFTLKSVIALYSQIGLPLIFQLYDISKFFDKENLKDGLNSIYESGIKGKLYKLFYELNIDTLIQIRSSSGLSEIGYTGENITQGSVSGAIISAKNLDSGIQSYFKFSQHEISYSNLRLQPLIFQDDIARLSSNRDDAQAGNVRINDCLESKLLDANTDKTVYILIGEKYSVDKIRQDIMLSLIHISPCRRYT